MNTKEQEVELLVEQITNMIASQPVNAILDHPDIRFRKAQEAISQLSTYIGETNEYLKQISMGNLDVPLPSQDNILAGNLTELHSGLKHLTWQATQVVQGDYKQKSSFLGEFSNSFNVMIQQLEEREMKLTIQAEELTQSMELMISIMNKMSDLVIVVGQDSGEVIYANRSAKENYYISDDGTLYCQQSKSHPCDLVERLSQLRKNQSVEREFEFDCPTCQRVVHVETSRIRWNDQYAYVYFLEDVTAESDEREALENMAFQDQLTGLYNRRYCMSQLNKMIQKRQLFSVCVADLNQLKVVNDTHGHLVGDDYIFTVSEILNVVLEGTDGMICRVGGDEFILLLPDMEQSHALSLLKQAETRMLEIEKTKEYPMSISYGVVEVLPKATTGLEQILAEADSRMYQMKESIYQKNS